MAWKGTSPSEEAVNDDHEYMGKGWTHKLKYPWVLKSDSICLRPCGSAHDRSTLLAWERKKNVDRNRCGQLIN